MNGGSKPRRLRSEREALIRRSPGSLKVHSMSYGATDLIKEGEDRVEQAARIIALNIVAGLFDLHPARVGQ